MFRESASDMMTNDAASARRPIIAIIGRPNAGKSTLFNRLVRAQRALVDKRPGVTRDRNIAPARWQGREFVLIDTGGFEDRDASHLAASVRAQAVLATDEADAVIVLFDGREGLNPADRDLMERMRRLRKPTVFAVNKLDSPARDDEAAEFFTLGVTDVFPVSAAHGRGIGAMVEHVFALLDEGTEVTEVGDVAVATDAPVALAIVGRPNAGKSSLLNRLVGYERAIVDAAPGTTRDALDTPLTHAGRRYVLVDTAGIRRRPRILDQVERASVVQALRVLERAEVALLVIDATQGMTDQDARIAGYAWDRGRALLFVVNKWDAVPRPQRDRRRVVQAIREQYPTFGDVPAVCVSARTGAHIPELFPALEQVVAAHRAQVRTAQLNQVLADAVAAQAPPSHRGKRPRLFYVTQTGSAPPIFTIFCSHPELVATAYTRYLAHTFRAAFVLPGTPLRVRFRPRASHEQRA
jgi:GTP-binding protein